jgi:RNA recognition motif-containing protein
MTLPPHLANIINKNKPTTLDSTGNKSNILNDKKKPSDKIPAQRRRLRKFKNKKELKKKWKILRNAAGEVWEDPTLEDWPDSDFRVFCGDLGNEVTDEILANAFRKYPSFQKARVIRDKRTGKTKGFGFISFANAEDYIKAMREMNGKYVGNRPIRMTRSTWKDRALITSKSKVDIHKYKKNKPKIRNKILINNANIIQMENNNIGHPHVFQQPGMNMMMQPNAFGFNQQQTHHAGPHHNPQNNNPKYNKYNNYNNQQQETSQPFNPKAKVNNRIIYK